MNHTRKKWLYAALLALVVVALLWAGWRSWRAQQHKQAALQAQQTAKAPTLRIAATEWMIVAERSLPQQVKVSGSLTAVNSSIIKARVSGELQGLEVREGDFVRKGQIVARIDATESEARYRQARLQAESSKAQVTIQQRQYDNNRALVDKQFISPTALATSEANLQGAKASYAAAQAAADAARKVLDDTVLRSPIDGQVAKRWAQSGERVNVESQILEIINPAVLELVAPLPPQDSLHVQVGQTALLRVEGAAQPARAKVVRISPSAQDGSRTVPAYLRMEHNSGLQLRPGLFVEGVIETGTRSGIAVPVTAVRNDQPQPYVQIVQDGKVQRQPVQLGAHSAVMQPESRQPTEWVMVEGLASGAQLLLAGVGPLPEGTQVDLTAPAARTDPGAAAQPQQRANPS